MKCNVNRLLSLALVLVMLVGILPLTAKPVEAAATSTGITIFEDDFEHAKITSGVMPDGWGSNAWSLNNSTTAIVPSGNDGNCLKLDASNTSGNGGIGFYINSTKIPARSTLTFSVDCKMENTVADAEKPGQPYVFFTVYQGSYSSSSYIVKDANSKACNASYTTKNNETWVTITKTFTEISAMSQNVRVILAAYGGNIAYFDNVKVTVEVPTVSTVDDFNTALANDQLISLGDNIDLGSSAELALPAGTVVDLNGYALSAKAINGSINEGKLIDSSAKTTGRVSANLDLAENNGYLPVYDSANSNYLLVQPNMDDRYFTIANTDNGFKMAFRPGFGTTGANGDSVGKIVADAGESCTIDIGYSISWEDAYSNLGKSGDLAYLGSERVSAVYDAVFNAETVQTNNKFFVASFTNPGDFQWFKVTITVSSCGVIVSSDITATDAGTMWDNPIDDGLHYYIATDFTQNSSASQYYSGRGEYQLNDEGYGAGGTYAQGKIGNETDKGNYFYFDGTEKDANDADVYATGVLAFSLDIINDAATKDYKTNNLVVEYDFRSYLSEFATNSNNPTPLRYQAYSSTSSTGRVSTNMVFSTGGGTIRGTNSDGGTVNISAMKSTWQTIKIEIDLVNEVARVTIGAKVVTYKITQVVTGYFQIVNWGGAANDAGFAIDNFKVYSYTDPDWSLTV